MQIQLILEQAFIISCDVEPYSGKSEAATICICALRHEHNTQRWCINNACVMNKQLAKQDSTLNKNMTNTESLKQTNLDSTSANIAQLYFSLSSSWGWCGRTELARGATAYFQSFETQPRLCRRGYALESPRIGDNKLITKMPNINDLIMLCYIS